MLRYIYLFEVYKFVHSNDDGEEEQEEDDQSGWKIHRVGTNPRYNVARWHTPRRITEHSLASVDSSLGLLHLRGRVAAVPSPSRRSMFMVQSRDIEMRIINTPRRTGK